MRFVTEVFAGWWNWWGAVSIGATVAVAWFVYRLQQTEQKSGSAILSEVVEAVRRLDEERAERQDAELKLAAATEPDEFDSSGVTDSLQGPGDPTPPNLQVLKDALEQEYSNINWSEVTWRRKAPVESSPGNFGWFASEGHGRGDRRWFVRVGNGTTVRPAIPHYLLDEWEKRSGRSPREVRLDYPSGSGKGNHAWYLKLYNGTTWRVSVGGRGHSAGEIHVAEI